MKKIQTIIACLIVLAFVMPFGSCLKENDKKPDCRIGTITEIHPRGKTITLLTYNSDGKIATIDKSESVDESERKVFTYNGNTITVNVARRNGASITHSRDSIAIDDRGRPLNIRKYSLNDTRWTNNRIIYNGDELVRTEITTEANPNPQVSTPTYVNGNMVSTVAPWGNYSLEYYTDKELQQGDYLEISNLLTYGISIGPNKNLLKTLSLGGNTLNFDYELNSLGYISTVTILNGTDKITLIYHYVCD